MNLTQLNLLEAEIAGNPLGTFGMRGFACQKWANEKLKEPVKSDDALEKGYPNQRAFRNKWARKVYSGKTE